MNTLRNSLRSVMGKTVNLYLKDGSVIACVTATRITNSQLWIKASIQGKARALPQVYPLRDIRRAETVMIYANL